MVTDGHLRQNNYKIEYFELIPPNTFALGLLYLYLPITILCIFSVRQKYIFIDSVMVQI